VSKFSLEVLNRSVFPHFKSEDPDVILGASFGEDIALTRVGSDVLVSHVDPIVGAVNNIGWLAVHVACNDIATSGTPPRWIQVLVLLPDKNDESLLERIMSDIEQAAAETGVSSIGGHTGYSASLSRPLVAVTALGTLSGRDPVLTKGGGIGDHILITKGIALEGTAILANDFSEKALELSLTKKEIEEAKKLITKVSVIPEALNLASHGATAMHDVTRGGLLETLLEIALLSNVGIQVTYNNIPIPPVVSRFVDAFQFDPMKMISSGTLVAAVNPLHLEDAKKALKEESISFADIGEIIPGEGVHIIKDSGTIHYQEIQAEEDELARLWTLYTPDKNN
jgi:hydrogenase expression/formation protein HypE